MAAVDNTTSDKNHIVSVPLTTQCSFGDFSEGKIFSIRPGLDGVYAIEKASCLFASALTMLNDLEDDAEYIFAIHHLVDTGKALIDSVTSSVMKAKSESKLLEMRHG